MYAPNCDRILSLLKPSDKVLDIGGWGRPFNRANYVMDAEPFETRGYYGKEMPAQGGAAECFTKDTWITRDICARTPYPFADKELDFVICSQTLEDVRDPLWVCSEMIRIAKQGYLEVPSRIVESSRDLEPGQVGWTHHRWLIDIHGNSIRFLMKYHMIHRHWRFSFPRAYVLGLPEEQLVQWVFWKDKFDFSEITIHGVDKIASELEAYVQRIRPYPRWKLKADLALRRLATLSSRVTNGIRRRLGGRT